MKIAHVYIEHSIKQLDCTFTYRYQEEHVQKGVRVRVPFGNQVVTGFVDHIEEIDDTSLQEVSYDIKDIYEVLDEEPLLNEELFSLGHWMSETCIAPTIRCFQTMLPSKLKPRSKRKAILQEAWVKFVKYEGYTTKRQQEVLEEMAQRKSMLRKEFLQEYKSVGKKLIACGCLEVVMKEKEAHSSFSIPSTKECFTLSDEQQQAIQQIQEGDKHKVSLLHGVTGSGKTEVFLQLAKIAIQQKKQVLLLVPEISLTPQIVKRVKERFGSLVAIYHSGLNDQEKYEQYQLVKHHKVSIVVGTRSAIFMPFHKLGFIILDEEHDHSYKQDVSPRYHCRDIAIFRGEYHQCKVVLASATPSLETYARAYKGVYQLVCMKQRINGHFPNVHLVEMKKAMKKGEHYLLSDRLLSAIYDRLQRREQMILLLNRRGYTSILRCVECGYVTMCPQCDIAMSYHKTDNLLKCHTCGEVKQLPAHCPSCTKKKWAYLGLGTQKLEELIKEKFPTARVLRMDADTTTRKDAHEQIFKRFQQQEADLLLGTQMIAKGLDFEKVTLVGIINGDALLNRSDYRCAEVTYDLLAQACGRSGRGKYKGEVIIQAYDISHYAITCAAQHEYLSFFQQEMQYRHLASYPPYTYLVSMVLSHKEESIVVEEAFQIKEKLGIHKEYRILGPSSLLRIKNEYRYRILLKGKQHSLLKDVVKEVYKWHYETKQKSRLEVDLQPIILD
ncbi:MAG: primosomal protein N' [Erysipelotrichaceae bacterium]|nr:primosomal protein N' [Erysipelotrichaceae bacterium]